MTKPLKESQYCFHLQAAKLNKTVASMLKINIQTSKLFWLQIVVKKERIYC